MKRLITASATFVLVAFSLYAQGVTTGSVSGVVRDAKTGSVLAGATVSVVHVPSGTKYGAIARKNGSYKITGMRVGGPYLVSGRYVGYASDTARGVFVSLAEDKTVNLSLRQSQTTTSEVVVSAAKDAIFDQSRTGSGTTITTADIEASPSINRSLSDIARANPYANQVTTFGGDDGLQGISVAGANSRYNNIQIDGAVANDMFGLGAAGTAGSQANANVLSLDAIEQLQVNISPYDVRQSGFTGGLINAVTRAGTNKLSGSVFSFGRNQDLVGLSPDNLRREYSAFRDFQFGARIGGAIIPDEAFFHITTEIRLRNRPIEIGINNPGALTNFPHSKTDLEQLISIAKTNYNYDAGRIGDVQGDERDNIYIIPSRNNSYNVIARLDLNLSQNHKLQFRHNYTNAFQDRNVQRTPTIFSLSSQLNEFRSISNSSVLQLNSIVGDNISNELRISYNQTNDERVLKADPFPQVQIYLNTDYVLLGPERNSQANALDQTQIALTDNLSWFLDEHTLSIGTHNEYYRFNNLFLQDYYGFYSFKDINAFRDSTPSFYSLSYANLNTTNGEPKPRAAWNMMQTGFYVQDDWKMDRSVTLSVGLRADIPIYLSKPYSNPMFSQVFDSLANRYASLPDSMKRNAAEIPAGLSTDKLPGIRPLWSPRIGMNINPFDDGSLQIRMGSGIFTGRVVAVWLSNQFSNTGVDLYRTSVGSASSTAALLLNANNQTLKTTLDPYSPLKPGDGVFSGSSERTTAINVTSDDFATPQVWRSTFGADYRVMKGITITGEGMYSSNLNTVEFKNLNLRRSTALANSLVDGRPLYARNSSRTSLDSNASKLFTQVIQLSSRDAGYQYSAMIGARLEPSNPWVPRLSANFSYVYSAAYDLADATAATASSNWQNTDAVDPNHLSIARSNFDVPHRYLFNASYEFLEGDHKLNLSVFYSANSGQTYDFVYTSDINGDGVSTNDLIYVPKPEDFGTTIIPIAKDSRDMRTSRQIFDQLQAFIDANPTLKQYQGQILPRNSMRAPFVHQLDLRVSTKAMIDKQRSLEISLDVQNLLNLLSSDWGLQKFVNFQSFGLIGIPNDNEVYDSKGRLRMVYTSPEVNNRPGVYTTDSFFSRWRMQLGLRFNF